MIKINLLGQEQKKKRRARGAGGPSISLKGTGLFVVFAIALVAELGGLYWWYSEQQAATEQLKNGQQALMMEQARLKKIKSQGKKLDTFRSQVEAQRVVFKALQNGKVGPLNALIFLSYALQRVDATLPEDEYSVLAKHWTPQDMKRLQGAGLDNEWDPNRVWLKGYKEENGEVEIRGEAKDHEDVMAFLQRLRTTSYFEGLDLVEQKRQTASELTANAPDFQTPYIAFKLKGLLNFDPDGYPPL